MLLKESVEKESLKEVENQYLNLVWSGMLVERLLLICLMKIAVLYHINHSVLMVLNTDLEQYAMEENVVDKDHELLFAQRKRHQNQKKRK